MKELSIIIPHYKEPEMAIFPLLSSINTQLGIDMQDIEIIIVTDGGGKTLDADFLALFNPVEISQIALKENGGPGIARQTGIDAAKGRYLLFCDADDILHNVGILGAMLQEVERTAPDILTTQWLEELKTPEGKYLYLNHEDEMTWMHGKMLRREYLRQIGVRHHPELRVHEDSYFLSIAASATDRIAHLPVTSYVWKWGDDTITRRNNQSYTYDSFPAFIFAVCESLKVIAQDNPAQMQYRASQIAIYVFFALHKAEWGGYIEYLKKSEESFKSNFAPYWKYLDSISPMERTNIYSEERQKNFAGCIETEALDAWIERMRKNGR